MTVDHGCDPLGKQGAGGALIKVTLMSHGYTFLGKGTVGVFIPDLQREATIYERLRELQGICIPVCLGAVDLPDPYFYDVGVRIVHMLLQSWGGEYLDDLISAADLLPHDLDRQVIRSLQAIHNEGVIHHDVHHANMLWNEEGRRVMFIDFERSRALPSPRLHLSDLACNTHKKRSYAKIEVGGKQAAHDQGARDYGDLIRAEISTARSMYRSR